MNTIRHFSFAIALLLLLLSSSSMAFGGPVQAQNHPQSTPGANERPDACEPGNDRPNRACVLEPDAINGPYTFLPEGDQDYYSLFLPARDDNLATAISVRGTSGLDLRTTVTQHESGERLGVVSSPAISTTLAPEVTGWVILRVENRSPAIATGQSYSIEVRSSLPTPLEHRGPAGEPVAREIEPDALENNYDARTAAPIAVNAVYDLNFICPVEHGCPDGDHDYLRTSVKAGVEYLLATFDLAPGVDTTIDLFWDDPQQTWIAANDDLNGGMSFLSAVRWRAPMDGLVLVRIGPRSGSLAPIITDPDEAGRSYRFAMVLADSALGQQLGTRVAEQALLPTPTPLPSAAPAVAQHGGGSSETAAAPTALPTPTAIPITDSAEPVAALVITDTTVLIDPEPGSAPLDDLSVDAMVQLTGRVRGVLIEITSERFVGAGWVDRRVLRPITDAADLARAQTGTGQQQPNDPGNPVPSSTTRSVAAPLPAGSSAYPFQVSRRNADLPPTGDGDAPLRDVSLRMQLRIGDDQPLAGIRVQLLTATGELLTVGQTGADGQVTLNAFIPDGTALLIQSPALLISQLVYDPTVPQVFVLPNQ